MHRNRFVVCLCSLLLGGWLLITCTTPENKKPENLIDADRMADILTEVHLAEARVSKLSLRSVDSSNIIYKHLEFRFLKRFGVDTARFRTSYIFYSSHPQQMEIIYMQVVEKLQKKVNAKRANHV